MIEERYMPLPKAARILGITRKTARKRLEKHCGLTFRRLGRGNTPLIAERDVQRLIDLYTGQRKWSPRIQVAS